MLPGIFFATWRFFEIVTLIPVLGMLSWFVHGYTLSIMLTPTCVLVLFIVSVLACFWAVMTLLAYGLTKHNAHFVGFVDLVFVGALIAGVYELRGITHANCNSFGVASQPLIYFQLGVFGVYSSKNTPWGADLNKNCSILKACFAFGIMNILFFFVTFVSSAFAISIFSYFYCFYASEEIAD
jgi:hypothetical protein